MLKILAMSDEKCDALINILQSDVDYFRKEIDLVISCGDLRPSYIGVIASILNKMVYYVEGNHHSDKRRKGLLHHFMPYDEHEDDSCPGGINVHKQYIVNEKFRITGFEGCMWYNGEGKQYKDGEMNSRVNSVINRIHLSRFKNKLFETSMPPLITVSHAPIKDVGDGTDRAHRGFSSFRKFVKKVSPALWLYGHKHLTHYSQLEAFHVNDTVAVNCYGYKFIGYNGRQDVRASFNYKNAWQLNESGERELNFTKEQI